MTDLGLYTCEACHRTFQKKITDAEAAGAFLEEFGADALAEPVAIICDECYWKLRP